MVQTQGSLGSLPSATPVPWGVGLLTPPQPSLTPAEGLCCCSSRRHPPTFHT